MIESEIRVDVSNDSAWDDLDLDHWGQVIADTLAGEGIHSGGLDLLFVDVDQISELNQQHMGKSGPTDVLSFPLDEAVQLVDDGTVESVGDAVGPPPQHLGDVVVCPTVADRQAPEHCGDVYAELTLLIVHGVLHILGHDHAEPEEAAIMMERERVHMARCGFAHPGPVSS